MPDAEDIFDYTMGDQFISETRPRPYRTGFRPLRHPSRPSLAYINSLPDHEFLRYIQNGCRFPDQEQDLRDRIAKIQDVARAQQRQLQQAQDALRVQAAQLQELRLLLPLKRPSTSVQAPSGGAPESHSVRGLDVAKR